MSNAPVAGQPWRLKISQDLSIADILTVVCIGGPMLMWGAKMDTRVENMERVIVELHAEDRRQVDRHEATKREFRDELREISRKLDNISERLPPKK